MTYSKPGRLARAAALIVVLAALASAFAGSSQAATKYKSCNISKYYYKLGATYVEKLGVSNVTCSGGLTVIKTYNACRNKHGGAKGKCTTPVDGFKCTEKRTSGNLEFVAVATCTKGREALTFDYTEAT